MQNKAGANVAFISNFPNLKIAAIDCNQKNNQFFIKREEKKILLNENNRCEENNSLNKDAILHNK